jgi:hypothetical protein
MSKKFSHFSSSSNSTSSSFVKSNFALQTIAKPFGSKHLFHGVQWPIIMKNIICLRWLVWKWHLWIAINSLAIENNHFLSIYLVRIQKYVFPTWQWLKIYAPLCTTMSRHTCKYFYWQNNVKTHQILLK